MTSTPRPAAAPHHAHPRRFTAATWNVFHGTPREVLEPVLARLLHPRLGVSLIFGQEMIPQEHRHMLRDAGLAVAYAPTQYVVAWDPDVWARHGDAERVLLSQTPYYTQKGHEMETAAVLQRLTHIRTGKVLAAMSYHLPSAVQKVNPPANRVRSLHEAAASWRRLAGKALGPDGCDAVLFAGDDNVDERLSHGPWRYMLRAGTGLRQVQAPTATHGKVRRIDDFRERGLGVYEGRVIPVPRPDDHDVHVREFRWR